MCNAPHTAPLERGVLVRLAAIDMLLRWSKEVLSIVLGLNLVAFTISDEPSSYIQLT